jgi:hypothetical protein
MAAAGCASEPDVPRREPETGAPEARITCHGTSTVVETPVVETTPAGVVFEVDVPRNSDLGFIVREAGGTNAETGPFVWVVPPGEVHVACLGHDQDAGDDSLYETLRVIDPEGNYRDPTLGCANALGVGMSHGPARVAEPEEQALDIVEGLRPDDVVERAAYRESRDEATVRIVRDGTIVATLEFEHFRGWIFRAFTSCPDAGLSF